MTIQTHVIDILVARYLEPIKRPAAYLGLAIYTMVFRSGHFFKGQEDFNSYCRDYQTKTDLFLFEVARGPSGCFDHLLDICPKDFENELHRRLEWSDFAYEGEWFPPTEVSRLVCDRGTFITLETLATVIPGFVYPSDLP